MGRGGKASTEGKEGGTRKRNYRNKRGRKMSLKMEGRKERKGECCGKEGGE